MRYGLVTLLVGCAPAPSHPVESTATPPRGPEVASGPTPGLDGCGLPEVRQQLRPLLTEYCLVPEVDPVDPGPIIAASDLANHTLLGTGEYGYFGLELALLPRRDAPGSLLVTVGAKGVGNGVEDSHGTVLVFDELPTACGASCPDLASTVFEHTQTFGLGPFVNGLTVGNFDGADGADLAYGALYRPYLGADDMPWVWTFSQPLPEGTFNLALANPADAYIVDPGEYGFEVIALSSGDLNGDEIDDLVVTSPEGVTVYPGPLHGLVSTTERDHAAVYDIDYWIVDDAELFGGNPNEHSRGAIPDMNCDGQDDLLLQATGHRHFEEAAHSGAALLFTDVLDPRPDPLEPRHRGEEQALLVHTCEGTATDAYQAIGDVTGDGHVDIGAVATFASPGVTIDGSDPGRFHGGIAYILSGLRGFRGEGSIMDAASAAIIGEKPSAFMREIAGLGDLDGDGVGDFVVSAYNGGLQAGSRGAAYIFLGPVEGIVDARDADLTIVGADLDADLGGRLATGDLDGDGVIDLVLGAPSSTYNGPRSGAIYTFSGVDILAAIQAGG